MTSILPKTMIRCAAQCADFVRREINPYVDEWEEKGIAPAA
ncbi:MAG: hypothetical protein R2861_05710 [Desulfobacterales bacterium]